MLNEVLKSCKNDTCWYKSWCKTRTKRTGSCIFTEISSQNLKYNVKQAYIFNLIFVGIPSSLILSVKNRGIRGFLLNYQNLISMMKVFCWGSLNGWLLSLEFRVSLLKFFPSPEMKNFYIIPDYNLSWYTELPS